MLRKPTRRSYGEGCQRSGSERRKHRPHPPGYWRRHAWKRVLASSRICRILEFRRPQDVVVPPASSDEQRARVLTGVKALRFAPPPLRGASGPDAGSAHARPDWLLLTMPAHTTPTCCGRPSAPESIITQCSLTKRGMDATREALLVAQHTPTDNPRGPGRAGRVAERSVVPGKPSNVGGGKGPWFENSASRRKGHEDW